MHGNYPWVTGDDSSEELTAEEQRGLLQAANGVAKRTREYLPGVFDVQSGVGANSGTIEGQVAVHVPMGQPVAVSVPPAEVIDEDGLSPGRERELAQELAARTAHQVKRQFGGSFSPTAQ